MPSALANAYPRKNDRFAIIKLAEAAVIPSRSLAELKNQFINSQGNPNELAIKLVLPRLRSVAKFQNMRQRTNLW